MKVFEAHEHGSQRRVGVIVVIVGLAIFLGVFFGVLIMRSAPVSQPHPPSSSPSVPEGEAELSHLKHPSKSRAGKPVSASACPTGATPAPLSGSCGSKPRASVDLDRIDCPSALQASVACSDVNRWSLTKSAAAPSTAVIAPSLIVANSFNFTAIKTSSRSLLGDVRLVLSNTGACATSKIASVLVLLEQETASSVNTSVGPGGKNYRLWAASGSENSGAASGSPSVARICDGSCNIPVSFTPHTLVDKRTGALLDLDAYTIAPNAKCATAAVLDLKVQFSIAPSTWELMQRNRAGFRLNALVTYDTCCDRGAACGINIDNSLDGSLEAVRTVQTRSASFTLSPSCASRCDCIGIVNALDEPVIGDQACGASIAVASLPYGIPGVVCSSTSGLIALNVTCLTNDDCACGSSPTNVLDRYQVSIQNAVAFDPVTTPDEDTCRDPLTGASLYSTSPVSGTYSGQCALPEREDCAYSQWSAWTETTPSGLCTSECTTVSTRTRSVATPACHGGLPCAGLTYESSSTPCYYQCNQRFGWPQLTGECTGTNGECFEEYTQTVDYQMPPSCGPPGGCNPSGIHVFSRPCTCPIQSPSYAPSPTPTPTPTPMPKPVPVPTPVVVGPTPTSTPSECIYGEWNAWSVTCFLYANGTSYRYRVRSAPSCPDQREDEPCGCETCQIVYHRDSDVTCRYGTDGSCEQRNSETVTPYCLVPGPNGTNALSSFVCGISATNMELFFHACDYRCPPTNTPGTISIPPLAEKIIAMPRSLVCRVDQILVNGVCQECENIFASDLCMRHKVVNNQCIEVPRCSSVDLCTNVTCVNGDCIYTSRADTSDLRASTGKCVVTTCNPDTGEVTSHTINPFASCNVTTEYLIDAPINVVQACGPNSRYDTASGRCYPTNTVEPLQVDGGICSGSGYSPVLGDQCALANVSLDFCKFDLVPGAVKCKPFSDCSAEYCDNGLCRTYSLSEQFPKCVNLGCFETKNSSVKSIQRFNDNSYCAQFNPNPSSSTAVYLCNPAACPVTATKKSGCQVCYAVSRLQTTTQGPIDAICDGDSPTLADCSLSFENCSCL